MQCPYKHTIYIIDKKAIEADITWLNAKGYVNKKNLENLGYGNIVKGIEKYFTGKWWVYYDRDPYHSKYLSHRKLAHLGYFKCQEVGCGKCEICRVEHSKEWTTKGWCESQMWKNKTFITLTYNNKGLPADRRLRRSDIQKFWKDLRYHLYKNVKNSDIDLSLERELMEKIYTNELEEMFGQNKKRKNKYPLRYLNCGEYGPKTKRPHYHAVIWNFEPQDLKRHSKDRRGYWIYTSRNLEKIWGKGYVIVGNATAETVGYVARYCTKKYSKTEKEIEDMKKKKQLEFIGASSLGFIGYYYWIKFKDKIKKNMGIIMKMKEHTFLTKLPKAMSKKWKEENESEWIEYDYWKNKIGEENWKNILSKTDLNESDYIMQTYNSKLKKYRALRREKGDLVG